MSTKQGRSFATVAPTTKRKKGLPSVAQERDVGHGLLVAVVAHHRPAQGNGDHNHVDRLVLWGVRLPCHQCRQTTGLTGLFPFSKKKLYVRYKLVDIGKGLRCRDGLSPTTILHCSQKNDGNNTNVGAITWAAVSAHSSKPGKMDKCGFSHDQSRS